MNNSLNIPNILSLCGCFVTNDFQINGFVVSIAKAIVSDSKSSEEV